MINVWPLNKIFKNATLKEPEWWKQSGFVKQTGSGQMVTTETAMRVSTVHGCVRILSESISALPLKIYEKTSEGKKVSNHPLNDLFMLPNEIQTGFEMREFNMVNLALRGNQYTQVLRSQRGKIGEMIPLYSQHMDVNKNNGKLVFDYQETGASRVYSQKEIWRTAGIGTNGVTGLSTIDSAKEAIGLALALEEHGAVLFKNGTQPGAIFEIPGALGTEAFDRLNTQLKDKQGSANAHDNMILENGMTIKNLGMTSENSQFIETRKQQIADIARYYRIPLHMLNELDKATFSNIEHQSIEFVTHTLVPWLVRLEQSIYRDLLTPDERKKYYAKHNVDGLLRGDTKARYEAHKLAIDGGWRSANEAREKEDENTVEGLDEYRSPLNMASTEERARMTNMEDEVIKDLVEREIRAVKRDKDKDPAKFIDFYSRHLKTCAKLLSIEVKDMIPYGQKRLEVIEKGIDDEFILNISANAAHEMREILCQK